MATKLIQLEDGTLVEVEAPEEQARQISGSLAEKVDSTFDKICPVLIKVCRPISSAWHEINQEMRIEQAEVEINFSFEAEGNLYITKTKAGSNLTVKMILKPQDVSS